MQKGGIIMLEKHIKLKGSKTLGIYNCHKVFPKVTSSKQLLGKRILSSRAAYKLCSEL